MKPCHVWFRLDLRDPAGDYVRRWVPELARLPAEHLHAPWAAPITVLEAAGVRLGETYPRPFGTIGWLVGRLFVQRRLKRLFAFRHAVTRQAFEHPPV